MGHRGPEIQKEKEKNTYQKQKLATELVWFLKKVAYEVSASHIPLWRFRIARPTHVVASSVPINCHIGRRILISGAVSSARNKPQESISSTTE